MYRIIADSDDEEEHIGEELSIAGDTQHNPDLETATDSQIDTKTKDFHLDAQGTSSSERLRQEIEKVHSALLQTTPRPKRQFESVDDLNLSSNTNGGSSRVKRVKTSDSPTLNCHGLDQPSARVSTRQLSSEDSSISRIGKVTGTSLEPLSKLQNRSQCDGSSALGGDAETNSEEKESMTKGQTGERLVPMVVVPARLDGMVDTRAGNSEAMSKRKKISEGKESQRNNIDSDELAIDLPKEQYRPRPTRSRSNKTSVDVTDITRKSKLKRRKTVDDNLLSDCGKLREMGVRSSQAENALLEADGNLEKAISLLFPDGDKSDYDSKRPIDITDVGEKSTEDPPSHVRINEMLEVAKSVLKGEEKDDQLVNEDHGTIVVEKATKTGSRGRGRPKKGSRKAEEDANLLEEVNEETAGAASDRKQFEIPEKDDGTLEGPDPKAKRVDSDMKPRKTSNFEVLDTDQIVQRVDDSIGECSTAANTATTNDKSQEKPIKATEKVAAESDQKTACHNAGDREAWALQSIEPNSVVKQGLTASPDLAVTAAVSKNEGVGSLCKEKTPEGQTTTNKTQQSPLSKAKMPYKVGLSKKARIEPLLRIIKK